MTRTSVWFALFVLGLNGCGPPPGPTPSSGSAHQEAAQSAGEDADEGHTEEIVLTADAEKIAGIKVEKVRLMPLEASLSVPGTIANTPQGKAVVTSPVAGRVTALFVKVGDTVRAGQAVATVRSVDAATAASVVIEAQRDVAVAQAGVREAKAQVDLAVAKSQAARRTLNRQEAFAKTGAFSQPALQAAQREFADAEAELERGLQDQTVHEAQLERAERLYKQELISRTELEQARLEVATDKIRQRNAERRIELAKSTYERERLIADKGLSNSRELHSARADLTASEFEVRQARIRQRSAVADVVATLKGLEAARAAYSAQAGGNPATGGSVTVIAPIGGIVTLRGVSLGEAVDRTTAICEVEDLKSVWAVASVSEKDISVVQKGATAQVSVATFPNRVFPGIVQVVSTRLDPKTRSMPVYVLVENSDGELRAAMFARVFLGMGSRKTVVAVARGAVVDSEGRNVVYVKTGEGHFEEREVDLGRVSGDLVEILNGLEPGDLVVTVGTFVLKSEKVKRELKGHDH